jgi:hypothetical protein
MDIHPERLPFGCSAYFPPRQRRDFEPRFGRRSCVFERATVVEAHDGRRRAARALARQIPPIQGACYFGVSHYILSFPWKETIRAR